MLQNVDPCGCAWDFAGLSGVFGAFAGFPAGNFSCRGLCFLELLSPVSLFAFSCAARRIRTSHFVQRVECDGL